MSRRRRKKGQSSQTSTRQNEPSLSTRETEAVESSPTLGQVQATPTRAQQFLPDFSLQLVDPLFAVALHVGCVEGIMKSGWFEATRLPSRAEWFAAFVFLLGVFTLILSWFGYHVSVSRRPIRGVVRFFIDVVLVMLYAVMMVKYEHFDTVLLVQAAIFALYFAWDAFKIAEYPIGTTEGGFMNRYRRELVSLAFAILFILAYVVELMSSVPRVVLLCASWVLVLGYRMLKKHRLTDLLGFSTLIGAV